MAFFFLRTAAVTVALVGCSLATAPTDEYRDSDIGQTSYYDNHRMDPSIVDSPEFGLLWKVPFNAKEQV